jgi:coenzyme F420-reducing hydrogenase delta subunit
MGFFIKIMAQRFTDSNKWLDNWFSNLPNDYKLVWLYLLDTCDNAGIFQINIRLLNFNCSTNITEAELLETFKGRVTKFDTDKCIINKFCIFQYGTDFLNSKNKAVVSAIKKLIIARLLDVDTNGNYSPKIVFDNTIDTLSIPYNKSIDTPKDKEQVKEKDKIQDIKKDNVNDIVIERDKVKNINQMSKQEISQSFDELFNN